MSSRVSHNDHFLQSWVGSGQRAERPGRLTLISPGLNLNLTSQSSTLAERVMHKLVNSGKLSTLFECEDILKDFLPLSTSQRGGDGTKSACGGQSIKRFSFYPADSPRLVAAVSGLCGAPLLLPMVTTEVSSRARLTASTADRLPRPVANVQRPTRGTRRYDAGSSPLGCRANTADRLLGSQSYT
ncbi:hypothetical protein RRG08_035209 [Elysia crispata]|uniref:Uncharacterized protein n=1 Tax=Elysia crispata TaxID=231223 RepID=A0AAE1DJZ1_9GAST|nr:hypothetical protein RRG08_035209 [Elysia crispata]